MLAQLSCDPNQSAPAPAVVAQPSCGPNQLSAAPTVPPAFLKDVADGTVLDLVAKWGCTQLLDIWAPLQVVPIEGPGLNDPPCLPDGSSGLHALRKAPTADLTYNLLDVALPALPACACAPIELCLQCCFDRIELLGLSNGPSFTRTCLEGCVPLECIIIVVCKEYVPRALVHMQLLFKSCLQEAESKEDRQALTALQRKVAFLGAWAADAWEPYLECLSADLVVYKTEYASISNRSSGDIALPIPSI
eukprot:gene3107-3647_t